MKKFIVLILIFFSCKEEKKTLILEKNSITVRSINDTSDNLLTILTKSKNTLKNRDSINNLAIESYSSEKWSEFKKSSKLLFKKAIVSSDSLNLARSYRYLGNYFYNFHTRDSSFYYYLKSEKLYKALKKYEDYANILLKKGIVQYEINDFLGSSLSLNKSLFLYNKTDDNQKKIAVLNALGLVSRELKEYNKSIEYHSEAINLIKKTNQDAENLEAIILNNIGLIYQSKGDYLIAISNYKNGLKKKNVNIDSPDLFAHLKDNMAYSKLKLNDFENLPDLFFQSLKIRDSINDKPYIILSNIHISEYYYRVNNYDKSIEFANKALTIAKRSSNQFDIVSALKQAAAVDKQNASKYTEDYIRINDSLQVAERKNLDRFARIQLETDEVIKENKELGILNRNLVYYLLGTLVIFSLLIVIRTQKLRQKVIELKQEQQATNQEIYYLLTNQQETIENTQIQEKNRMAKELHDGILSQLFGLRLNLESIYTDTSNKASALRINYIEELKGVEKQIREISHDLNSEKAKISNNFVAIVIDLLEKQQQTFSTKLKYDISKKILWKEVDTAAKINTYRILQESLQNSNKYAESKNIIVVFDTYGTGLLLTITDDGKGFDVSKKNRGIGIINMKERALESFGSYKINSEKNKGTTTTLMIPYKKKQQI